ncbi:hypothetical protein HNR65_003367 [Desulfosalsimonas propionicica]|uniref:Sulfotransferase family protein n=1 Tax=Desulfosalsimonas propionicica TaxID=332175 RepID=A0A7W0HM54_9BACT|nr:hypothetical protein [Desulfosalsimonas propionicica]MBA2883010.1 hypothetical protein [Desulfosalsimonas propionicica]
MFISEKLVFTELHKTGGTHICSWLEKLVGGEKVGKHNRIPPSLWDRFIIGSIRNPWEWYVSLWAYGCGGEGSAYHQTTRRVNLNYLNRQLHGEMGLRRLPPSCWALQLWHDIRKPVVSWRSVYGDPYDAGAFRNWLRLMLNPARRFDMGEGFGFSPVSMGFGLMTYRCLKLFTRLRTALYKDRSLAKPEGIRRALDEERLVCFVIRNECLEKDLLEALALAGCEVSDKDRCALFSARNNKINTSRRFSASHYYDRETVELVANREKVIIENYGYTQPEI